MTINHSKTGRSTSLALSALLLAASVTPQLNFGGSPTMVEASPESEAIIAASYASVASGKIMSWIPRPNTKWLGRAARLAAVGALLKVVFQKSKVSNDPSLICSPHAGIWQKLYHFYNRYVVGQKGGRARFVRGANGENGKLEPETPTYGLAGTFWANHKDIVSFLGIYCLLERMMAGFDRHIEETTGTSGVLNRILSFLKIS